MSSDACGTSLDSGLTAAVLPADNATLATSLSQGLMLVAHTGNAHLGVSVDRALLRGLARAQGVAARAFYGSWAREQATSSSSPDAVATYGHDCVAWAALPEVIPFRHATSHTFAVSGTDVHLTLHATRDPIWPDVHVELRMNRPLIARLAQHQHHLHRRARLAALLGFFVAAGALLALVGFVA